MTVGHSKESQLASSTLLAKRRVPLGNVANIPRAPKDRALRIPHNTRVFPARQHRTVRHSQQIQTGVRRDTVSMLR
jgi:hypothetical protein